MGDIPGRLSVSVSVVRPVASRLGCGLVFHVVCFLAFIELAVRVLDVKPESLTVISLATFEFGTGLLDEFTESSTLLSNSCVTEVFVSLVSIGVLVGLSSCVFVKSSNDGSVTSFDDGVLLSASVVSFLLGFIKSLLESVLEMIVVDVGDLLTDVFV